MVLFLHNRYRTTGGEERVVNDLLWLVREHLDEPAELLERDSASLGRPRAALGLLRGGLAPEDVAAALSRTGARVVHAHNLQPALGWRALAAARAAGARVVLHLHQYRLVCANGVCFTQGQQCTRCHGRNTLPGVLRNCRGNRAEAVLYGAALSLWQQKLIAQADVVIVPSEFARERLGELGAPLQWERVRVLAPPVRASTLGRQVEGYALVVSRLSPEKGIDVAIEACRIAGIPLVIAGEGPQSDDLRALAGAGDVRFVGRVDDEELAVLRSGATIALVPSRSAETFGLAAAEAMMAGVPVAGSRVGALGELIDPVGLVAAGDATALAQAISRLAGDASAGERGLARATALCGPETVAARLARIYAG
jgi:glycosyltransferase involved in cell wall biosynthesis